MKKKIIAAIVAPVAIAVGWTACAADDNSATEAAKYATTHPVVTVAVPAKPAPTVTVTRTASVAQVPQSCLDALDNADTGFTYAGQIMNAAAQLDSVTMNAYTEKLNALAPTYNANKAACRQAGGQG
jgi:hypothetical protein